MARKGKSAERKSSSIEIKDVDVARGLIVGVPSVFGVVDDGGDRVQPGAFAKTLGDRAANMATIKLGYQHDLDYPFGVSLTGQEVGREGLPSSIRDAYPEATGGLEMVGKVMPMNDRNRERLEYVASGVVTGSSFAYDVMDADFGTDDHGGSVRELKALRLHEWGPVTIGMNAAAAITDVKATLAGMTTPDAIGYLAEVIARTHAEVKAGRVLSTTNLTRLQAAIEALQEILAAAQPGEGTDGKSGETTANASAALHTTGALREIDDRLLTLNLGLAETRAALAAVGG